MMFGNVREPVAETGPWRWRAVLGAMLLLPGLAAATTSVNHKFDPLTILQGDVSTYTIEIVNDNIGAALTSVNLTALLTVGSAQYPGQPLPKISVAGSASNSCGGMLTASGTSVILTGGGVPKATDASNPGKCTITVPVTSTTVGNQVVYIPANTTPDASTPGLVFTEGGATNQHNATEAKATLQVNSLQAPTGGKTFAPSPSYVGLPTTLTITLTNPNAGATMPLTSFTDTLPTGMVVAPTPNASVTCSGTGFVNGAVSASAGGGTVSLNGGTIGQNGTCQVKVDVVVPALDAGNTSQNYTNTVPAGAIGNTRGLNSPQFQRQLKVSAPVRVAKSFTPSTIPVGAPSTLKIVVTNNGGTALTNAAFTDTFPSANLVVAGAPAVTCSSGANGTATVDTSSPPNKLLLSGATVAAAGGTCTVTVPVKATAESQYDNTLPANAVTNDQGIGSPAATGTLHAYSQLRVSKAVSPSQGGNARVAPGQWVTFSINVENYASEAVTNAVVTDNLPLIGGQQMLVDGSSAPTSSCGFNFAGSVDTGTLSGSGGSIPAASGTNHGTCTVTFRAKVPESTVNGGTLDPFATYNFTNTLPTNSAVSGTGQGSGNPIQNTNTVSVNGATVSAVELNKVFNPGTIAVGQTSELTITVINRTVNPLTGINLTDSLPTGLVLAANPNASTTCTGGSLQAFPGDTKVVLTGAQAPARGGSQVEVSCEIKVLVTSTTPNAAPYTNTIKPVDFTSVAGTIPANRSANLTVTAGLSATKQFSPASVAVGGVARATVTVLNQSSGQLTNVSVNDDGLAGGLVVANPANAATSCGDAPVITANPGATGVRLDGVTLPAGGACDLSFDVIATGAGPWSNTIAPGKITSAEGPTNSQVVASTLGSESTSLSLVKGFNPLIVTGNQPSTLTINVSNTGGVAINNVAFTDAFPQGIQVYSTPNAQTTCTGGTVTAAPGASQVALTGANLGANASCTVTVQVTSVAFLNLTNTIPAKAVTSQGGYTNAQATSATLTTLQGLGVSKGFAPAYVPPNAVSRLKIRLVNTFDPNIQNPTVLTGVTYTDQLPSGLVFAATPNATSTCSGAQINVDTGANAVTLSGVTLVPGSTCDLEVNVTAGAQGQYLNSIPANSVHTNEGVTNTVPGEATLNVVPGPSVTKMFGTSPVRVGLPTELVVTVTNNANVALTGLALTDSLPPNLAVANPANTSTTCTGGSVTAQPGTSSVSLSGATVPASPGSCTFRAQVVASKADSFTNTIGQNAITSQQGLTNGNPTSAELEVLEQPGISKSFTPAQIASGGTSALRIRLENPNASPITLTSALVDALPGNVLVAATPNINGNLGVGATACPGTVTATAGAINLSYANGAQIPAGGCTISVDVTSSTSGSYLNTIAAGQLKTSAGNNPDPAQATLGVDQPAAPTVQKAFAPSAIDQGGTSKLTITLGNPNATALTLASDLTDTLPANVVVAAAPNVGGTCTVGSMTAAAGGSTVVYAANATIPAAGCTITVDVTSSVAGSYTNTILAGDLVTVEAGANPTPANAGLVVRAPGAPTVQKAFAPSTINPGGVSTLTITLGNPNATAATLTADLVDTLPTNVVVAATPAVGGTCTGTKEATAGGSTVAFKSGGSIPANGFCTITVNVSSTVSGGPYTNTIAAGDLKTSLGSNGAPATANLLVNPGQPPSVSKSFAPSTIVAGQQSTLTISLGNGNAAAATLTADLVDSLPMGVTVANPAAIVGTCTLASVSAAPGSSSVIYASGATIPAGGCSIQVRVTSSVVATHTNNIPAGALKTDIGANAVPATAQLTVIGSGPGAIASIAGTVYHDRNDNGVIDGGEEGIAAVVIRLMQGGTIVATTTTDAGGHYSFTNLAPGTYSVVEVQPSGWTDGKDTVGIGASGGLGSAGNDVINNITLVGGDAATQYNFGERRPSNGVASIPTLSEWSLIALSMLLAFMGWRQLSRRSW